MYEFLVILFSVITCMAIFGMFKFGFNIIFLYIILFSLVFVIWLVAVILEENKKNDGHVR